MVAPGGSGEFARTVAGRKRERTEPYGGRWQRPPELGKGKEGRDGDEEDFLCDSPAEDHRGDGCGQLQECDEPCRVRIAAGSEEWRVCEWEGICVQMATMMVML